MNRNMKYFGHFVSAVVFFQLLLLIPLWFEYMHTNTIEMDSYILCVFNVLLYKTRKRIGSASLWNLFISWKYKKQNDKKSYPPYNIQISEKELKELQDKIIDIIKKNGETDVLDGMEQKDKKGQIAYLNKILQKSKIITKGTFVTTECWLLII